MKRYDYLCQLTINGEYEQIISDRDRFRIIMNVSDTEIKKTSLSLWIPL